MEEIYLDKKIVFEDGKLYCNAQEISIEKAEEIIKIQINELQKNQEKIIIRANDLDEDRTRAISNTLNETFVYASNSGIHIRGNNEYYEAGDLILEAELVCNKALRLFSAEYRKEKKLIENQKNQSESIINKFNWDTKDPTNKEIIEKSIEMYISAILITEIRKQFYNIDFKFNKEDIKIYLNLPFELKIYIIRDDFTLCFEVNQNIPKIYDIPFNFIITSMVVNGYEIQSTFKDLLIGRDTNVKFAQSMENAIFKEIRFLKNQIKEEIDYSLKMNISKAKERFNLARKILEKYSGLLNEELLFKLNTIIEETKDYKNIVEEDTEENKIKEIDFNKIISENISKTFNIDKEKIEKDLNKIDEYYEITLLGQKINIYINEENVKVKSINTIGSNKNDIEKNNIKGKDIFEKINRAINYSYLPIIYRSIDNILKNTKVFDNRKKLKIIDEQLKSLILFIYSNFDIYENIDYIQEKIDEILDTINSIGKNINIEIFSILDFILFKSLEVLSLKEIDISRFRRKISNSYKEYYSLSNDFFDTIIELNRLVKRVLNISILSKEIDIYLNNIFDISVEKSIIELTNILIEDYTCGKICRNLLSLLDISDTSKDDSFKFQVKNNMLELISVIL